MTEAIPTFTVAIAGFGWWGRHIAVRLQGHPWLKVAGIVEPVYYIRHFCLIREPADGLDVA